MMPTPPESATIVRVDLATRQLDTVGVIKIPKVNMQVSQDDKGNMRITSEINPLPVVDEWAVLSDGSIAFVRGRDYHVDFVNADGTKQSAPKIPFEWQRLSDEDKVAFIDSVKAARARLELLNMGARDGGRAGLRPGQPDGGGGTADRHPDGAGRRPRRRGRGAERGSAAVQLHRAKRAAGLQTAIFRQSVRADAEGNLWVRTIPTKQIPGGPVYDVINREGKLVDRVQIPMGRTIAGFGLDGAVYLVSRDGSTMTFERARAR